MKNTQSFRERYFAQRESDKATWDRCNTAKTNTKEVKQTKHTDCQPDTEWHYRYITETNDGQTTNENNYGWPDWINRYVTWMVWLWIWR